MSLFRFFQRRHMSMSASGSIPIRAALRYHALSVVILVAGLSLTALAFISVRDQDRLTVQEAFLRAAQTYVSAVSQGLAQSIQLLRSVEAHFRATGHVSRESFSAFVQPLLVQYPGVQAVEWIPRVSAENRDKYEKAAQRDFPRFRITERIKQGVMAPAKPRPEYFPVYYVEPYKGNETALGFDLGSNPARLGTLIRAQDTGNIVASPRVVLVQEKTGQFGLLIFDPLYRSAHATTPEERRAGFIGFVLGVFRIGDVVETAIGRYKPLGVNFTIYDRSADLSQRYLYTHLARTRDGLLPPHERDRFSQATKLTYTTSLNIDGRTWALKFTPAPGHYDTSTGTLAWAVFLAGCAITLAMAIYVQTLRRHSQALAFSESMLAKSQEVAHLGNWEWDIQENKVTWSDETYRIFGVRPQAFGATYEAFLESVHPDDRASVTRSIDETLAKKIPYNIDHRIVLPDETVRFVHEQGEVVSDTTGKPVRLFGIVQDITEHKTAEDRIEFLAYYDALTGLPNRTLLRDRIAVALASARRQGKKAALLFLDLDHFKTINDSLGHSVGDLLLKEVAERLKRWSREQDSMARLGGDEFVILLPDIKHVTDAAIMAERIVNSMATTGFAIQDRLLNVTCSIGISIFPDDGTEIETLIKNADAAMYYAKENGRNNFQFFTKDMSAKATQRLALENGLRLALERKELFVVYQPQVNIATGKITGSEALLRWQHPDMGLVPPDKFIPVAEDSGLIVPIGEWVLKTVCHQARQWQDQGLPALPVAVNVSAVQFRQKDFLTGIKTMLREAGLSPQYLELELTESLLISNVDVMLLMLQEMKDMGLKLLIDDFGTGYSSLSYLRRLPIHKLKIDRSFVRDIASDPDDAAITGTIISMAKSLNLKVIAEGVENEEQMDFLRNHECDEIQGFYFSKPVPAEEFAEKLLNLKGSE